jgi:broad specificity phosphatase PhoE
VTTTFFLVRHAIHDTVGAVLCGRMQGVHLGEKGRGEARRLGGRLAREAVSGIYTSPIERAQETAMIIGSQIGQPVDVCPGIAEIDFGEWTGARFEDLARNPQWAAWNSVRSVSRPPGGESMLEVQARAIDTIERLRSDRPDTSLVLVSHGDVIKAILLYGLGLPLDAWHRFDIDPASISTLATGEWGSKVIRMNETVGP